LVAAAIVMTSLGAAQHDLAPSVCLSVRVLGAHAPLAAEDFAEALGTDGGVAESSRLRHLQACSKILVLCGSRVVGLAAYENHGDELRVRELATTSNQSCGRQRIVEAALDALELACLAGGAQRILIPTRRMQDPSPLCRRGFTPVNGRFRAKWLQKRFR